MKGKTGMGEVEKSDKAGKGLWKMKGRGLVG